MSRSIFVGMRGNCVPWYCCDVRTPRNHSPNVSFLPSSRIALPSSIKTSSQYLHSNSGFKTYRRYKKPTALTRGRSFCARSLVMCASVKPSWNNLTKIQKAVEGVRCVPRCHGSTCFIFSLASWSKGPSASPISHNRLGHRVRGPGRSLPRKAALTPARTSIGGWKTRQQRVEVERLRAVRRELGRERGSPPPIWL